MDRDFLRISSLALSISCALLCSTVQADEVAGPLAPDTRASAAWHNDLDGPLSGQVDFAQTHTISAQREIVDPLLVPDREALVVLTPPPHLAYEAVKMVVRYRGVTTVIPMTPPQWMPENAVYDQSNTFSGHPVLGAYPKFRERAFTATIPYDQFSADTSLSFYESDKPADVGTLAQSNMIFLNSESDGLVLMNIKGCIFKRESDCKTTLDQYDIEKNPQLAKIAAREIFSELPIRQLVFGMGQSYWPYIVARGPDGMPHRYSTSDRSYREWAEFGDKTLPAKVGMGNYWRAASDLGYKQPGKFVAISGQLLDVPNDIPVLPPGVGASCGGNSCNYPSAPVGFWHEVGHGLGLPHSTPPRYEKWAYRSYDLKFLPNYHPDPHRYGLGVDYLGLHYFGHVVGSLTEPAWPGSTASAPWVDEFEALRNKTPLVTADWRHYIAPYTHQQMLRVQQRFGSFPAGLQYAGLWDDHRPPPKSAPAQGAGPQAAPEQLIDSGIDEAAHDLGTMARMVQPGQTPLLKGVPVQTLVVTMANPQHDAQKLSQIYPPIISNYGNVFASTVRESSARAVDSPTDMNPSEGPLIDRAQQQGLINSVRIQSAQTGKCLSLTANDVVGFEPCSSMTSRQRWYAGSGEHFTLFNSFRGACLNGDLQIVPCTGALLSLWTLREDLTNSKVVLRLQNMQNGKFITAGDDDSASMEGVWAGPQEFYAIEGDRQPDNYALNVKYVDGSVDHWALYSGNVVVADVVSAAVNVSAARKPLVAELLRNGVSVDRRMLDSQPDLPAPIVVGAEAGYPVITPQYLRSRLNGRCLSRAATGLIQQTCTVGDVTQQWGMSSVLTGQEREFLLTGLDSASCLGKGLTLSTCQINTPQFQWRTRTDIAMPGAVMLQGGEDGKFITLQSDAQVGMQALTEGAEQNFDRIGPDSIVPLKLIFSVGGLGCVTRLGDSVVKQPCTDDINQQWRIGELTDSDDPALPPGPYINIVSPDGSRCLEDGLKMTACQVDNRNHRWALRADFPNPEFPPLQSLFSGTFITASLNDLALTQAANSSDSMQRFVFLPVDSLQTAVEKHVPSARPPKN
ncbi:TagA domain-containing protein [Pseudomonas syringae]|uniref:TagA domain-containing protein n=1 Tax=Pseudomonas syringae TaxID=317 RepID=UPI0005159CA0|nr:TagA domain-containing protein [Pseudomonas syringae]QGG74804.1 hypothetical protein N028_05235 [Pseudomonas syringae USA011]